MLDGGFAGVCSVHQRTMCGSTVGVFHGVKRRIPLLTAQRDSDKELWDDGHVEQTFVAEQERRSPEEAPEAGGSRMTATH